MILLRLITWPYVRKHLLRSVLTTAGIVLGVALLVGMQTANRSVLRAFNDTVERIAGKAQLQVSAGDAGFGEDVLERVQSLREVRAAAPVIEAEVDTGFAGQGKLLILAVDMTGDRSLRDYDFDNADAGRDRRSADLPGPARFADPHPRIRRPQSHRHRRQGRLRHHGGPQAVHRARHPEGRRHGPGLRRQPGHHGHLRRAERLRPRPPLRPHRYRPAGGRHARAGRRPRCPRCWARASPSNRPRDAAASSNRCSASTPWP